MILTRRRLVANTVGAFAFLLAGCRKHQARAETPGVRTIGGPGRSLGRFVTPRAVGVVGRDILVADRSGRVQRFTQGGAVVEDYVVVTDTAGFPLGIAETRDGGWLLSDTHHAKLRFFDAKNRETRAIEIVDDQGRPTCPQRAVRDADGLWFMTEFGEGASNRVRVYGEGDRLLRTFGGYGEGPGQFMRPIGVALIGDEVFVADVSDRIQVFTKDGVFQRQFGKTGGAVGELRYPHGLAAHGDTLYVAEFGNHRVQRFGKDGTPRGAFGKPGPGDGEFAGPWDVAVNRRGELFVADAGNHRVCVISPEEVRWDGAA